MGKDNQKMFDAATKTFFTRPSGKFQLCWTQEGLVFTTTGID